MGDFFITAKMLVGAGDGPTLTVAVEGCLHGELDRVYETLAFIERQQGVRVDVLLCCGDFQAVRDPSDLEALACPPKYRALNSFYKYYSGEAVAPCLTLFVGGNHEASNHLQELPHGGWVAPNIYFLGRAGVVDVNGVRIGGLGGIFNERHYRLGVFEAAPYSADALRSVYHTREIDVFRLCQLRPPPPPGAPPRAAAAAPLPASAEARGRPVDIFLSHDWPLGVALHGDTGGLLRRKRFLADEVRANTLGSRAGAAVLATLRPAYWFAAHLHTKYAAIVRHGGGSGGGGGSAGRAEAHAARAALGGDTLLGGAAEPSGASASAAAAVAAAGGGGSAAAAAEAAAAEAVGGATRFLALDKCLPQRDFLQVLQLPSEREGPAVLSYDAEWLAAIRTTSPVLSASARAVRTPPYPPVAAAAAAAASTAADAGAAQGAACALQPSAADVQWVLDKAARQPPAGAAAPAAAPLAVPCNFAPSKPPYRPAGGGPHGAAGAGAGAGERAPGENPQTRALLRWLELPEDLDRRVEQGPGLPGPSGLLAGGFGGGGGGAGRAPPPPSLPPPSAPHAPGGVAPRAPLPYSLPPPPPPPPPPSAAAAAPYAPMRAPPGPAGPIAPPLPPGAPPLPSAALLGSHFPPPVGGGGARAAPRAAPGAAAAANPEEISLDDDDDDDDGAAASARATAGAADPSEIALDDDDEEEEAPTAAAAGGAGEGGAGSELDGAGPERKRHRQ